MATIEALNANEIITKTVNDIYELKFDYLLMNDVMRIVKEEQLGVIEQQFDTHCTLKFEVRKSNLNLVLGRLEKIEGLKTKYIESV